MAAGGCSGVSEAILVNPFEVVKVKMQSDRANQAQRPSTGQVARQIIKESGLFTRDGLLLKVHRPLIPSLKVTLSISVSAKGC